MYLQVRRLTSCACLLALALTVQGCQPDPAEAALQRGTEALNQMQMAAANEHLTEAIRLDSTRAEAYLKRGQVWWMSRGYERAVEDLDRALALDSSLAWGYFLRGSSLFALDSLDAGLGDFERAATSADLPAQDRARAQRMRGIVFMQNADYEAGAEALGAAIALQPDHAFHYYERGLLYAALGASADAVGDLEHFLRADSTGSEAVTHARLTVDSLQAAK
jgi:tetratricopeptide (TPR) repeat protein